MVFRSRANAGIGMARMALAYYEAFRAGVH
jgi:hypothetical protein